ncbi:hypothetical protein [Mesorhizobium cantuariense]|uniref:Uncharacterized protein n=1 Tax=Mesorhizobium cantuariense TaxID=1300275 RepID=A0ABV7MVX7_9HYPH
MMVSDSGDRIPDFVTTIAESANAGAIDRREFLAIGSPFGATTAVT